jgi:EmrB/QacA subfamily drug resistance transporter
MKLGALEQKKVVAVVFVLGLFMDILDTTIVNVALPDLAKEFHASTGTIEWVVTGYLLSLAMWVPASGWIGDRFGTKKTFIFALSMFTGASMLCGLSWSIGSLIGFRVLQGVGGGMLTPVGTAMLWRAYPPIERARASAILASVTVLAPAIGPVLGGFLVEFVSWRAIFFVNVPIGVVGIVFSVLYLREHKEPTAGGFDLAGFVLAGGGLALLLFALSQGPTEGWGSPLIVASFVASAVATAALIVIELRIKDPMLDLRLLAERSFRTPNVVSFATTGALIGMLFLLPQLLQGPRGLSPFQSGLTTFPQAIGVIVFARQVGTRLYPRIGPRRLAMFGTAGVSVITFLFMFVGLDTSQWTIRAMMFVRGGFMGFIFIPIQTAAFAQIKGKDTGRASALYQAQRQIASAVGVAILATVLIERMTSLVGSSPNHVPTPDLAVDAFHAAFFAAAVLSVIGFVAACFLRDEDAAATMRSEETPAEAQLASEA